MEAAQFEEEKHNYYYPKYVPNQQLINGLFVTEWLIVVIPVSLGLILAGIIGLIIGLVLSGCLFFLFVRTDDKRNNLFHELSCVINYYTQQQFFRRTARKDIKGSGDFVLEIDTEQGAEEKNKESVKKKKKTKGSKKSNKKDKKKKDKNMEELFPFKSINDGWIEMENGSVYCYFRIQANSLNLLSYYDLRKMISTFSRNLGSNKYPISFFIQDSIYKIQNNLDEIDRCKTNSKVPFLDLLLDQTREMINEDKDDVNKKTYFLRVKIAKNKIKGLSVEELQSRVIRNFKESLNPENATRDELKQMLAIYGSRIFTEELPDTELKIVKQEKKRLLRRKKETYEDTQLPGIYNFKNMIVPINTEFKPSYAKLGSIYTKTFAVASFLGSTKDTNLLSKISTMKGVTTSIYLNDLARDRYKNNVKLETRSKKATVNDEIDLIDAESDVSQLQGTYKRVKDNNQKLFYVTTYFQITAKSKKEFDDLEEKFIQEVNDVGITLDDLKTQQKQGYQTVSPIGYDLLADWTKQNIPSESAANLYPFNEPSVLDPTGLPLGTIVDTKLMVLFDLFTYRGSNFNILTLGASGTGKTVLLMLLQMICAMKAYYLRNIDFEGTYVKFYNKIGGINIDVSGGNEFCINPLQIRVPDEIKTTLLDDYISEVIKFIHIYKPDWQNDELDLFQDVLKKTYERFNITNDTDFTKLKPNEYPVLSDVMETANQERKSANLPDSIAPESMYQKLIRGLNAAVNGADASMFNRHTNLGAADLNNILAINFDMSKIMTSNKSRKLAQLMNIFTFISQFVNANMDGNKKIVVSVDELDQCLTAEYLPIVEIFNDYERRFRKRNACFMKATQTLDELDTEIPELKAKVKPLLSQPSIKFLFHLGDTDYESPQKLLNLTSSEINRLKDSRNGQCLMKVNQSVYDLDVLMPEWFAEVKSDVGKVKKMSDA